MNKIALITARARALFLVSIMAFALGLTACGDKDKKTAKGEADYGTLVEASMEFKQPAPRTVDNEEANEALKIFKLDKSGAGNITWETRTGSEGNYIFTNVVRPHGEEGQVKIRELVLTGVHMEEGIPVFDKMIMRDIDSQYHTEEEMIVTMPSPDFAAAIWATYGGEQNRVSDVFRNSMNGDGKVKFGFDHFSVRGKKIKQGASSAREEDELVRWDVVEFGVTEDGKGMIRIVNLHTQDSVESEFKVHIDKFIASGIDIERYYALYKILELDFSGKKDLPEITEEMYSALSNSFEFFITNNASSNINLEFEGMIIQQDSSSIKTYIDGDVVTQAVDFKPLNITFPKTVDDPEAQIVFDEMRKMGLGTLAFSSSTIMQYNEKEDWVKSPEGYVQISNIFRMDMTYDLHGMGEYDRANTRMLMKGEEYQDVEDFKALVRPLTKMDMLITYTDLGIIDRGFKYASEHEELGGMSVSLLKGKAKAGVSMMPMAGLDEAQQKLLTDMAEAFTHMIDEGGSVTFDFKPKMPIDVDAVAAGIENGEFDVGILGLTISHK